jgi:hypothetical protein
MLPSLLSLFALAMFFNVLRIKNYVDTQNKTKN